MAKEVDRQKVLQTTRVRTSLKDDCSWIHKSKQAEDSTQSAQCDVEPKPSQSGISHVLLTAKKFEPAVSLQEEQPIATKRPHTPTDNGVPNDNGIHELQPLVQFSDQPTAATTTEKKNDTEAGKSNEHSEGAAEVSTSVDGIEHNNAVTEVTAEQKPVNGCSADTNPTDVTSLSNRGQLAVHPEKETSDVCLTSENTKTVKAAEDAELETTSVANAASKKEAAPDRSVVPDLLPNSVYKSSSPPAHEASVQENDQAQAFDALTAYLVEPLLHVINTVSNEATGSDSLVDQSAIGPAAETVLKPAVGQSVEETIKEPTGVEKPSSEISEVTPDVHQDNMEHGSDSTETLSTKQPSLKEDAAVTKAEDTRTQNSVEPNGGETNKVTTKGSFSQASCEVCADQTTTDQESKSVNKTNTVAESPPEIPAVVSERPGESVQPSQDTAESIQDVTDAVSKEPAPICPQEVAETVVVPSEISAVSSVVSEHPKVAEVQGSESVADISLKTVEEKVIVEPFFGKLSLIDAAQTEECSGETTVSAPEAQSVSDSGTAESVEGSNAAEIQCTAETPAVTHEENAVDELYDQTSTRGGFSEEETVKAEIVVKSYTEVPTTINAAPETTVEENSPEPPIVKDAVPVEEAYSDVTKNKSPPEIPAVSSGTQATLELDDALESVLIPNGDAGQSELDEGTIELRDALTETPTVKTVTKSTQDPNQDSKVELRPNDNNTQMLGKMEEPKCQSYITRDRKKVCSHCDQFIGYIKIIVSDPLMYLHPECLKCGVCTKNLGDMLTPMYKHNQRIYCNDCYQSF